MSWPVVVEDMMELSHDDHCVARPRVLVGKRALDIVAAAVLLLLTAPVFAIIAMVVRRDGGPVLFRQRRVGVGGRVFLLPKFRTMEVDAEHRLNEDADLYASYVANGFKLPHHEDSRITRHGAFLRTTHLDELPQLLTVLKGDMSMVGPRPVVVQELDEYEARGALDVYVRARPGLTGAWQVNSHRCPSYDARVALDASYTARSSLRTDIRVILETVALVVSDVWAAARRRSSPPSAG